MKFKTEVIISILASGKNCHRQCKGLVDATIVSPRYVCVIFDHRFLKNDGRNVTRLPQCVTAERKLRNLKPLPLL